MLQPGGDQVQVSDTCCKEEDVELQRKLRKTVRALTPLRLPPRRQSA